MLQLTSHPADMHVGSLLNAVQLEQDLQAVRAQSEVDKWDEYFSKEVIEEDLSFVPRRVYYNPCSGSTHIIAFFSSVDASKASHVVDSLLREKGIIAALFVGDRTIVISANQPFNQPDILHFLDCAFLPF